MNEPKCTCFTKGRGPLMAKQVAVLVHDGFCLEMHESGICSDAWDYTLDMTIMLLIRSIARQHVGRAGTNDQEDAKFRDMLIGLEDRLRAVNQMLEAQAAGGVQ